MVKIDPSRDYYRELEVPATANITDIKKQYRKLALKYHPDRNQANIEDATRKFQLLGEAHEILSDPGNKQKYDSARQRRSHVAGAAFSTTNPVNPSNNTRGNPWKNVSTQYPPPPQRGAAPKTTPSSRTQPATASQRYQNMFGSARTTSQRDESDAARSMFDTYQNFRLARGAGGSTPASSGASSAQYRRPVPPPPPPPPSQPQTQTHQTPPRPPRTPAQRDKAEAAFGTRRNRGYQPNMPGVADEPSVTGSSYYNTGRHTNLFATTTETPSSPDKTSQQTPASRPTPTSPTTPIRQASHQKGASVASERHPTATKDTNTSTGRADFDKPFGLANSDSEQSDDPSVKRPVHVVTGRVGSIRAQQSGTLRFVIRKRNKVFSFAANAQEPKGTNTHAAHAPQSSRDAFTSVDGGAFNFAPDSRSAGATLSNGTPRAASFGRSGRQSPIRKQRPGLVKSSSTTTRPNFGFNAMPSTSDFNPHEWADKIGPELFKPDQGTPPVAAANKARSGINKPARKANVSDDAFATQGSVRAASPEAMDIDTPPPSFEPSNARNIPVEPTRPEWRSGVHNGLRTDGKAPFSTIPPSFAFPPGTKSNPIVIPSGSEDRPEFMPSFAELRNTDPMKDPSASGLNSWSDIGSTLPFQSRASTNIPIDRQSSIDLKNPDMTAPLPPAVPPALLDAANSNPLVVTTTIAGWNTYLLAFVRYMEEWEKYDRRMLQYLEAIQRQLDSQAITGHGYGWLDMNRDDGTIRAYELVIRQMQEVRERWAKEGGIHRLALREFRIQRDRVRGATSGFGKVLGVGDSASSPLQTNKSSAVSNDCSRVSSVPKIPGGFVS